jgi:glyoxylase I family protein
VTVLSIHHVSMIVSNTQQSVAFYENLLDLQVNDKRPDLGFPGAWFDIAGQQIHLLEVKNPDPVDHRPEHGGHDRHFAMTVDNIDEIEQRLEQLGAKYTKSRSGRAALFCRDPDGNGLEIIQQAK